MHVTMIITAFYPYPAPASEATGLD